MMVSNDQIYEDLKLCLSLSDPNFELLNEYKGVPFIGKATYVSITEDSIQLIVQPPASICLQLEGRTFLLSDGLFEPIEAQVLSFDIQTGAVDLGSLEYAGSKFWNRREVRVEPEEPFAVDITREGQTTIGRLVDVSMSGIGVAVTPLETEPERGEKVDLILSLPEGDVTLPGEICSISEVDSELRLGIEFPGNVPEKRAVVQYVLHRREQIRAELNELYTKEYKAQTQNS
jgi:hypothetical protein